MADRSVSVSTTLSDIERRNARNQIFTPISLITVVPFNAERPGIWRVLKSDHVTITKIENLPVEKFTDSKNAILLDLRQKNNDMTLKSRFRTVALPGG